VQVRKGICKELSSGDIVKLLSDMFVMDEQCGFRAGRVCKDNKELVVTHVIEKVIKKDKIATFVDLERVCDTV
jgi:hypothetical protein